jgi:acyl dehydratase
MTMEKDALAYADVDFGDDLPEHVPDVSMPTVRRFGDTTGMTFWRFTDHEKARENGLPGAIVPGIMSQGILVAMIHRWAPNADVQVIDTIFRSPLVVDSQPICRGVVTDMDDEQQTIQLDLTISNEAGETPVLGTATIKL